MGRSSQVPKEVDAIRQKARRSGKEPPSVHAVKSKGVKTVPVVKKKGAAPKTKAAQVEKQKIIILKKCKYNQSAGKIRAMVDIGFGTAPTKRVIKNLATELREGFIDKALMPREYTVTKKGEAVTKETKFRVSAAATETLARALTAQMSELVNNSAISALSKDRMTIRASDLALCALNSNFLLNFYTVEELERTACGLRGDIPMAPRFSRPRITTERLEKQLAKSRQTQRAKELKKLAKSGAAAQTEDDESEEMEQ